VHSLPITKNVRNSLPAITKVPVELDVLALKIKSIVKRPVLVLLYASPAQSVDLIGLSSEMERMFV
jgi:hypothetical protein